MQSFLERWRVTYLVVSGLLTLFFGYHCLHLKVDRDNRSMDSDEAATSVRDLEFQGLFPESEPILAAINRPELLDDSGRKLIKEIADSFRSLEGVSHVTFPTNPGSSIQSFAADSLISRDRETVGIQIFLKNFADDGESLAKVIKAIQEVAREYSAKSTRVAVSGLALQKVQAGVLVRRDQEIFSPLCFLILGGVLLLITRKWSGVFFPLLISATTICWTLGIYSIWGFTLNMITSLLPPVIMTLSVATTIHIYLHWLRSPVASNRERICSAIRDLYRPCLFASVTTAIGFLSLLTSHTPAVRQFGIFASLGVIISFLIGISGLAVGLSLLKIPGDRATPHKRELNRFVLLLDQISSVAFTHPGKVLLATAAMGTLSIWGISKIESNTDLLHFLGRNTSLYRDTQFINSQLFGVHSIHLLLSKTNDQPFETYEEVQSIADFQKLVSRLPNLENTLSLADFVLNPESEEIRSRISFSELTDEIDISSYLDGEKRTAKLTVRTATSGTLQGGRILNQIRALSNAKLNASLRMQEAGEFYRVITESNQLVKTQLKSFGIAIVLILIAIGIVFRSIHYLLFAIIPNIIPLLMTGAIMGFSNIYLSTGTAMIASVVIGIAVDDTIHYLSAYRKAMRSGNCQTAIRSTTRTTGLALLSTTLALSLGFWVAIFGSFQPTVHFALLSGLTMWFALVCDLLVLPACLKLSQSCRAQN